MKRRKIIKTSHEIAGKWWKDIDTGEQIDRNKGELLALKHSEYSEAWRGFDDMDKLDEHVISYPNWLIELADGLIRMADTIEAWGYTDHFLVIITETVPRVRESKEQYLLDIHAYMSDALEAARKNIRDDNNVPMMIHHFAEAWKTTEALVYFCGVSDIAFEEAIHMKMEYNRHRADHKHENRKKNNGKKF